MYEITRLDNGLKIVTESINFVRSISFGIWVKVGSQNENEKLNGISHFIEHMLFKGSNTRSARDIAEQMDAIGGQMNAFTTKQMTCYYVRILDENFDHALEILADMFLNSVFDMNEIEKEKKVILEEINMYEDTPEELVLEVMNSSVWAGSSIAMPILGRSDNIKKFTQEDIKNYYKINYVPENIIISVAGNFDTQIMINKIKKYFECLDKNNKAISLNQDIKYNKSIITKQKNIEQVHICLGFPGIKSDLKENYAMAILNTILGGGMSSRLYQTVREEHGLAYSVFSYNYAYDTVGLFNIYAAVNPDKIQDCIRLIIQEIKNLNLNKITQSQLDKTKEQIKANYFMSLESSSSRMNNLGKSVMNYNKILTPEEIIDNINQVSLEKIYELIKKIFVLDLISLSAVGAKDYEFEKILSGAI